jgi:SAM-dependent methyltransferase
MADHPDDGVRQLVHGMWAGVAHQWGEHAEEVDARAKAQTDALLRAAGVGAGDRVLELACGAGGTGLGAADLVGPEGVVVLSDVAETMVEVAANRAAGRPNVRTKVLDLEAIDEPDGTYDAVICREGLMFAVDTARAVGEVHRVLRPGGRAALSVWAEKSANPWLAELLSAASAVLGAEVPPPGMPGPFSLADADLGAALTAAGFDEVEVEDVPVPHRTPSFDAYWDLTTDLAGPLAAVLAGLDDETRIAIRDRLQEALAPYTTADGLDIPGVSRMVSGRRPEN